MTDVDDFAPPPPRTKITDFEGELLLITATEILKDIPSDFSKDGSGKCDVTVADVVRLGDGGGVEEFEGLWIFQSGLQGQLRSRVGTGRRTLGRLIKGASTKGAFQWQLSDPSENDRQLARRYLSTSLDPPSGNSTTRPPAQPAQPAPRETPPF
ncbi:hypothetical protein [Actinomadura sp. 9N215]|uniref:hypothetical protein n=1 Tax=Actinomadura sp. 9N215 TaxID=3375150 RepID=UPI0037ACEC6A